MWKTEDLLRLAGTFIEKHHGSWDMSALLDFLFDIQNLGVEINEDVRAQVTSLVEQMTNLYAATTSTREIENVLTSINDRIILFSKESKGQWDNDKWERLLNELRQMGIQITDETREYLFRILQATVALYKISPAQ